MHWTGAIDTGRAACVVARLLHFDHRLSMKSERGTAGAARVAGRMNTQSECGGSSWRSLRNHEAVRPLHLGRVEALRRSGCRSRASAPYLHLDLGRRMVPPEDNRV